MISHKVVFIGNSAVGKTSIINQYMFNSASHEHQPTVGIDFFAKTLTHDNKQVRLQIWDTAGQEKFHSLIPSYIRDSTVAIYVFDITSRESFESLPRWHEMVTKIANPVLIIVGNKNDLDDKREIKLEELQKFAESISAKYIETSAQSATNIIELFNLVASIPPPNIPEPEPQTKKSNEIKNNNNQPNVVNLNKPIEQNNGGGCGC